jgi:hypothetical protein
MLLKITFSLVGVFYGSRPKKPSYLKISVGLTHVFPTSDQEGIKQQGLSHAFLAAVILVPV